jgi:hypothetical protein
VDTLKQLIAEQRNERIELDQLDSEQLHSIHPSTRMLIGEQRRAMLLRLQFRAQRIDVLLDELRPDTAVLAELFPA